MIRRIARCLPIVVGALALGSASGAPALGTVVAVVALAASILGERWELDRGRQVVASALGGGVGYAAAALLFEERGGYLGEWWTRIAAGLLLAAAARFVQIRPGGGAAGTLVFALAAMVAIGETQSRGAYRAFVVLFFATGMMALQLGARRQPRARILLGRAAIGGVIAVLATALGAGTIVGVRAGHQWLLHRAQSAQLFWRPQTGFSDRMELGALDRLLDSDTVVLRVRGRRVDYLRGAVFDTYENGRWMRSEDLDTEADLSVGKAREPGERTTIHAVSASVDRFFLPLDARDIRPLPPARVDPFGVVKRPGNGAASAVDFLAGARERAPVAEPTAADLTLSRRSRGPLTKLAESWTVGASSTEERLDALERHLAGEYRYARRFTRSGALDPAMDFLFADRTGHCEYFATGMALLARSLGIPARVATGYRVAEHNRYGDYFVVRERNAHAWVEAFIKDRGWVTRDPTPASWLPDDQAHEASLASSALDVLRTSYDDATEWLAARTLGQTALATTIGFAVLLWVIARGARGRRQARVAIRPDETALPFLATLLQSLEREGVTHASSEPLERLAARLSDEDTARLLRRYAALRYGSNGDADTLAKDMLARASRSAE